MRDFRSLIFACFGGKLRAVAIATKHDLSSVEFAMPPLLSAPEVLNREFLEIRSKILELAAAFDRLERADGSVDEDPRVARLREALASVLDCSEERAEQVQMIFSRAYDEDWQDGFKISAR